MGENFSPPDPPEFPHGDECQQLLYLKIFPNFIIKS